MDIKNIFNILLLGLSVTTILITLVSYIIFRIRYSVTYKKSKELHHLDGHFFKRHAPHLEEQNRLQNLNGMRSESPRKRRQKVALVFLVIFSSVLVLLAMENYLSFRRDLVERTRSAEMYRELIGKGLLKKHTFDPHLSDFDFKEFTSVHFGQRLEALATKLRSQPLKIYSDKVNRRRSLAHVEAYSRWISLFERYSLEYQAIEKLDELNQGDLLILPQVQFLEMDQKSKIRELLQSEVGIFVTGALGIFSSSENEEIPTGDAWFNETFAIELVPSTSLKNPTIFVSDRAPWWEIPPGQVLTWYPIDVKREFRMATAEMPVASVVNYRNEILREDGFNLVRAHPIDRVQGRTFWSGLDPLGPVEEGFPNGGYYDSMMLSALVWISGVPMVKVANWKHGKRASMNVSMNIKESHLDIAAIVDEMSELKHQLTLFLNSEVVRSFPEFLKDLDSEIEIGAMTGEFGPASRFDLFSNFSRLEESRFAIEEAWHQEVRGFRPTEEKYDRTMLNAAHQNHLSYIFADNRFLALAPVWISDGKMSFFSRVYDDDLSVRRNPLLTTPEKIGEHYLDQLKEVISLGGNYLLNLNDHLMVEPFYRRSVSEFLKVAHNENVWCSTLGQIESWWRERDEVHASISIGKDRVHLEISHEGDHDLENVAVYLDAGRALKKEVFNRAPSSIQLQKVDQHLLLNIPRLRGGKKQSYEWIIQ